MKSISLSSLVIVALSGCGQTIVVHQCEDTSAGAASTGGMSGTSGAPGPGGEESGSTTGSATSGGDSGSGGTSSVIGTPSGSSDGGAESGPQETGADVVECDMWAQDCPDGQKCMPYESVPGNSWDALKCVPIAESPGQLGDPCTVVDHEASGYDSCDLGLMCWNVDPETLQGECAGFCQKAPDHYWCEDPLAYCKISAGSDPPVCLPSCDPLAQDCTGGTACYPISDTFICAPDHSGDAGGYGSPCQYTNVCDPGYWCGNAGIPGCESAYCCSAFCDLSQDPATQCTEGAAVGQECVPWFVEGTAPAPYENVGGCYVPPA